MIIIPSHTILCGKNSWSQVGNMFCFYKLKVYNNCCTDPEKDDCRLNYVYLVNDLLCREVITEGQTNF